MIKKNKIEWTVYAVAIALPLIVGTLSAFLTMDNMSIYTEVRTPALSPPGWLFPIVWSILYILMGISSAMIYTCDTVSSDKKRCCLYYYAISLVVNFAWSIIFFNMRLFMFAFIWLLLLLYLIIRTILCYFKIKPIASYLQIPYLIWVIFAGYLNLGIYLLN